MDRVATTNVYIIPLIKSLKEIGGPFRKIVITTLLDSIR
jgi:hypothetical protein